MRRKLLPNLSSFQSDKDNFSSLGTDYIYVLGTNDGLVKIGTTNDLWGRFKKLQGMSPKNLEPLMFWICRSGKSVEAALHALFRDYRKHGEWFYFGSYLAEGSRWKYRHLALSALLTCSHPPIPINGSILNGLQFEHVPDEDPIYDVPGGGDWSGRECYPSELFALFYPDGVDTFRLLDWPDEIRQLYMFGQPKSK
jgi:hypothetical protein